MSPQQELYNRFTAACTSGNVEEMRACVDPYTFFAIFPGHGSLTFDQVVSHFKNLRAIASDFGTHVVVQKAVEQGDTLVTRYYMAFTIDVDARRIELTSTDWVRFRDGKIVELFVMYDLGSTQQQLFAAG